MNNIYEIGGIADVLIKCTVDCKIGDKTYKAGEPYTLLRDVDVAFTYDNKQTEVAAKKPILASQIGRPTEIIIGSIPLTKKVSNLILSKKAEQAEYNHYCWCSTFADDDGILYLPVSDKYFIYDEQMQLVDFEYNIDEVGTSDEVFEPNCKYTIFYNSVAQGSLYSFEMPHFPYFALELNIKGNKDKHTNVMFMNFDAVSLVTVPNFDVGNGGILNTPLIFDIIYRGKEEPFIVM